jgi:hypothetical protein
VTTWGGILLVLFIVLGLMNLPAARATRIAVWATSLLLIGVWVVAWR